MSTREIRRRLRDEYRYPGLYPSRYVEVAKWDFGAKVIWLTRRSKKRDAALAEEFSEVGTTARFIEHGTCRAVNPECSWNLNFVVRDVVLAAW